jgi:hypothetical protein
LLRGDEIAGDYTLTENGNSQSTMVQTDSNGPQSITLTLAAC